MKNLFKFLLSQRLRQRKQRNKNWGFTLIELLVALLIAGIIISSLLGFMVDILTSDRSEQARAISEQEIQTAMDYIARDLEQAVYIYDASGLYGTNPNGVSTNPIINQLPDTPGNINPDANVDRTPVLVFWKRTVLPSGLPVTVGNSGTTVGELVTVRDSANQEVRDGRDYLVYSLVAYYLSRDVDSRCSATSSVNLTWACTNRIERWEIRDGIPQQGATARDGTRQEIDPANPSATAATVSYDLQPSQGFVRFSLKATGDNLMQKMNRWKRNEPPQSTYNLQRDQITTLIDFVDQSPSPTDPNSPPQPVNCSTAIRNVNTTANPNAYLPQQVPNYTSAAVPTDLRNASFYACVDSEQTVAQVYIRGNALARTVDNRSIRNTDRALYRESRAAFFPTASIQVKGRGLLNLEQQ